MAGNEQKKVGGKQEAASLETKQERLACLAQLDDLTIQRVVARNPHTPPEVLEKLSHNSDKAIRKAVAGNPNSPSDTLTSLGAQFPLDLLRNTALDWLLLENPSMLSEMPEETQGAIAKRENCTPEMLAHLGRAGSGRSLLLALIQNGKTPPATIKQIYEADTSNLAAQFGMREDSVRKIQPIASMHVALRQEPDYLSAIEEFWSEVVALNIVDGKLFEAANIPEKVRAESLAWDLREPHLKKQVFLPIPMLEVLAATSKDKRFLANVGKEPNSPEWLKGLTLAEQAKSAIEENAEKSLPELQKLLSLNSPIVNLLLANHPLTALSLAPSLILQELAGDSKHWVREYVASHPETLPETLSKLFDEHFQTASCPIEKIANERILSCIAENPNTPPSKLESLGLASKYEWLDVKEIVAKNPSTPASVLLRMAATKEYGVEIGLAENPNTPSEILEKLSEKRDNLILAGLASNPSAPSHILEKLAKKKDESILSALIDNPKTPSTALTQIGKLIDADADYYWLSLNLDLHPNVPSEVLAILADDRVFYDEPRIRRIALNPKLPSRSLEVLAKDTDTTIRKNVVKNPSTSITLLEELTHDENAAVRTLARKTLKTRNDEPNN